MKQYYIYIASSKSKILYIGVTNDIVRRMYEHKNKLADGFTKRYNINKLVYFEQTENVNSAIAREKELKGWKRFKKVRLIEENNPVWRDLYPEILG